MAIPQPQEVTNGWMEIIWNIADEVDEEPTAELIISGLPYCGHVRFLIALCLVAATSDPYSLPDPNTKSGRFLADLWEWYRTNDPDMIDKASEGRA